MGSYGLASGSAAAFLKCENSEATKTNPGLNMPRGVCHPAGLRGASRLLVSPERVASGRFQFPRVQFGSRGVLPGYRTVRGIPDYRPATSGTGRPSGTVGNADRR